MRGPTSKIIQVDRSLQCAHSGTSPRLLPAYEKPCRFCDQQPWKSFAVPPLSLPPHMAGGSNARRKGGSEKGGRGERRSVADGVFDPCPRRERGETAVEAKGAIPS